MGSQGRVRWTAAITAIAFGLLFWPGTAPAFTIAVLNTVDGSGELTGSFVGDLSSAPRWDSGAAMHITVQYNFESGNVNDFKDLFTWDGTAPSDTDFSNAVAASFAAWANENNNIVFTKTNTAVVRDVGVGGNKLEGNQLDLFAEDLTAGSLGATVLYGTADDVALTSNFDIPNGSNTFPSSEILSTEVAIDVDNDGDNWTLAAWQATFVHELGHALGIGDAEVGPFYDTDTTINNAMPINQAGDVRTGLSDQGTKSVAQTAGILMRSEFTGLTALAPDDSGAVDFFYPVPEPSTLLLVGAGLFGLARRRTHAR